jgi:Zn-dependent protease
VKCKFCGNEEPLPFKCSLCDGLFCSRHRLPENHECEESSKVSSFAQKTEKPITEVWPKIQTKSKHVPLFTLRQKHDYFWFSSKEIRHLVISALLVTGVGLSIFFQTFGLEFFPPSILFGLPLIFTLSFLAHELAHKLLAQYFGLWAEYRLTVVGAILTLISIISPIKIISPGTVMISGDLDRRIIGKTALVGPLTNIALSLMSIAVMFYSPDGLVNFVAGLSVSFNAWIALTNLLPFGMMDGLKVFWWNKIVWSLTFIASIALIVFSLTHVFA